MINTIVILPILTNLFPLVASHGMLLEPVNRASRWRFDPRFPFDYNDNQAFCGGFDTQWILQGGKCGLCGDNYGLSIPRPHEHGGLYGDGTIVKTYNAGDQLPIGVLITANHLGYFIFDLCNMDSSAENDQCFDEYRLKLITGEDRYVVKTTNRGWFNTTLLLPDELLCSHCVLRWTYITGNSWGICQDGSQAVGCGAQENFRSCADIRILTKRYDDVPTMPEAAPRKLLTEALLEDIANYLLQSQACATDELKVDSRGKVNSIDSFNLTEEIETDSTESSDSNLAANLTRYYPVSTDTKTQQEDEPDVNEKLLEEPGPSALKKLGADIRKKQNRDAIQKAKTTKVEPSATSAIERGLGRAELENKESNSYEDVIMLEELETE